MSQHRAPSHTLRSKGAGRGRWRLDALARLCDVSVALSTAGEGFRRAKVPQFRCDFLTYCAHRGILRSRVPENPFRFSGGMLMAIQGKILPELAVCRAFYTASGCAKESERTEMKSYLEREGISVGAARRYIRRSGWSVRRGAWGFVKWAGTNTRSREEKKKERTAS